MYTISISQVRLVFFEGTHCILLGCVDGCWNRCIIFRNERPWLLTKFMVYLRWRNQHFRDRSRHVSQSLLEGQIFKLKIGMTLGSSIVPSSINIFLELCIYYTLNYILGNVNEPTLSSTLQMLLFSKLTWKSWFFHDGWKKMLIYISSKILM